MKRGFIYDTISWIIEHLNWINLVEILKIIVTHFVSGKKKKTSASRFTVDVFIVAKWLFISLLWAYGVQNTIVNAIVWYLIITNLFTYFYHHTWSEKLKKNQYDFHRIRRRYQNLLLSIAFNVYCFAYFFAEPFSSNFDWTSGNPNFGDSALFSCANSLITDYKPVQIVSDIGAKMALFETITTFIFLTIILSNSIPQTKEQE